MKKFYKNILKFIMILFLSAILLDGLSMLSPFRNLFARLTNSREFVGGGPDEIRPYIEKARTSDGTTKLIIGDSVCRQLFNDLQEYNDDISIIGSNAAITMAGQYILVKEYLDNHPDATDVFLIVIPSALEVTYDTHLGYPYAVMPFVETDTLKYLDDSTIQIISGTYGEFFLNPVVVKALDLSAVNRKLYLNYLAKTGNGYEMTDCFELADIYVSKIYELCESSGVNFYLYPCPVCESRFSDTENMKSDFENSKLYTVNPQYMDMIWYYPSVQTKDNVHFSTEYSSRDFLNEVIKQCFDNKEIYEVIRFE